METKTVIPRFKDEASVYEIVLSCPACHWAIVKDGVTKEWRQCLLCEHPLDLVRVRYRPNSWEVLKSGKSPAPVELKR